MSNYTDKLLIAVQEIADIVYYQAPIEAYDGWLAKIIEQGLWEVPEDEGGIHGYQ